MSEVVQVSVKSTGCTGCYYKNGRNGCTASDAELFECFDADEKFIYKLKMESENE